MRIQSPAFLQPFPGLSTWTCALLDILMIWYTYESLPTTWILHMKKQRPIFQVFHPPDIFFHIFHKSRTERLTLTQKRSIFHTMPCPNALCQKWPAIRVWLRSLGDSCLGYGVISGTYLGYGHVMLHDYIYPILLCTIHTVYHSHADTTNLCCYSNWCLADVKPGGTEAEVELQCHKAIDGHRTQNCWTSCGRNIWWNMKQLHCRSFSFNLTFHSHSLLAALRNDFAGCLAVGIITKCPWLYLVYGREVGTAVCCTASNVSPCFSSTPQLCPFLPLEWAPFYWPTGRG